MRCEVIFEPLVQAGGDWRGPAGWEVAESE
jgi:hypothetical protein